MFYSKLTENQIKPVWTYFKHSLNHSTLAQVHLIGNNEHHFIEHLFCSKGCSIPYVSLITYDQKCQRLVNIKIDPGNIKISVKTSVSGYQFWVIFNHFWSSPEIYRPLVKNHSVVGSLILTMFSIMSSEMITSENTRYSSVKWPGDFIMANGRNKFIWWLIDFHRSKIEICFRIFAYYYNS